MKLLVDSVSAALMDKIQEEEWEEEARDFGKYVRTVCDVMDASDRGVDVEDYPRVMFESTRILESIEGEQQQADTRHGDERYQGQPHKEAYLKRGHDNKMKDAKAAADNRETIDEVMRRQRRPRRTRVTWRENNTLNPRGHGEGIRTHRAREDGTLSTA